MGLRDMLRAIREYPAARAELENTRSELLQARQTLEKNEQDRGALKFQLGEQEHHLNFLSQRSAALQAALEEFCPQLSTLGDMKRLYRTISPKLDPKGFTLYHMAERMTGIDVPSCFPYEDNRGLFEEMDGHQLMPYLVAAHFHAVDWSIVSGTGYERANLRLVDTSTHEYQAFEQQLYGKVLERMGFQDILALAQEVNMIEHHMTELKLYSPLSGELTEQEYDDPQPMDGSDLAMFQDVILQGIEDEQMPETEGRGLMAYFDGSDAVNEKVISLFPSVEEVDGRLYGAAVCQVKEALTPGEMAELKEYCTSQYADGWGEGYEQRPRRTSYGELYVSFWQARDFFILTKEEMETARAASRPPHQPKRGGEAR